MCVWGVSKNKCLFSNGHLIPLNPPRTEPRRQEWVPNQKWALVGERILPFRRGQIPNIGLG